MLIIREILTHKNMPTRTTLKYCFLPIRFAESKVWCHIQLMRLCALPYIVCGMQKGTTPKERNWAKLHIHLPLTNQFHFYSIPNIRLQKYKMTQTREYPLQHYFLKRSIYCILERERGGQREGKRISSRLLPEHRAQSWCEPKLGV